MAREHEHQPDSLDATRPPDERGPDALDPEDADDPGFGGGGGPAATIYGDDDDAEKHGDRLARDPDDSV